MRQGLCLEDQAMGEKGYLTPSSLLGVTPSLDHNSRPVLLGG